MCNERDRWSFLLGRERHLGSTRCWAKLWNLLTQKEFFIVRSGQGRRNLAEADVHVRWLLAVSAGVGRLRAFPAFLVLFKAISSSLHTATHEAGGVLVQL